MSEKGRGRGRTQFTFNIEAIGFSRGETLPDTGGQPLPLFPPTEYKPVPLNTGEDVNYILALKQELRGACKKLPYFLEPAIEKKDVDRYSEKYIEKDSNKEWTPDWRRLPRELKPRKKFLKKTSKQSNAGESSNPKVVKRSNEDIIQKLEDLEKKDTENKSDEETEEKEKDDENAGDEEDNEEEFEEENDYIASYFEDGDDYEASDENMDEATY
ncbi:DNA-directed RNA polymerase III subunit RPC7-like [Narcine bancroftii]|uniref:DNA-directed RNA polymerase III subunit RPC7-like n=1 Tax=Narcine bancroftii TaxID=1343680 RepID=UPI0038320CD9